jgi:hypothetical protein
MRIRTILAAAAAPLAIGGVLLTATAASASPTPGNGNSVVEINTQNDLASVTVNGVISKNIDFPATSQVQKLEWTTVNGNVSVEGVLALNADNIEGNVTVSGRGSELTFFNFASEIHGYLSITGSSGQYAGSWANAAFGDWTSYPGGTANLPPLPGSVTTANPNGIGQSQIDGGFTFTGNTATALTNNMGGGGPLHVLGKFTYVHGSAVNPSDGQTYQLSYQGGLQVDGKSVIS